MKAGGCITHLCDQVSIFSMNQGHSPQLLQEGKRLIELQNNRDRVRGRNKQLQILKRRNFAAVNCIADYKWHLRVCHLVYIFISHVHLKGVDT